MNWNETKPGKLKTDAEFILQSKVWLLQKRYVTQLRSTMKPQPLQRQHNYNQ